MESALCVRLWTSFVFDMLTFSGIGTLLGLGFVKLKGLGSETDDMIGLCY